MSIGDLRIIGKREGLFKYYPTLFAFKILLIMFIYKNVRRVII
jgi:hypothetical protein